MIEVIVTIVTILGGVVTLLSYFSTEKVRVTICCTESTLLTQKPKYLELLSLYSMKIRYRLKIFGEYVIR